MLKTNSFFIILIIIPAISVIIDIRGRGIGNGISPRDVLHCIAVQSRVLSVLHPISMIEALEVRKLCFFETSLITRLVCEPRVVFANN